MPGWGREGERGPDGCPRPASAGPVEDRSPVLHGVPDGEGHIDGDFECSRDARGVDLPAGADEVPACDVGDGRRRPGEDRAHGVLHRVRGTAREPNRLLDHAASLSGAILTPANASVETPPHPERVFDKLREMAYAELHCHSNFSFLDGASFPEDLVHRAAELGYRALALTDHNGFYGVSRFWQAARETGLPVIYGVEVGLPLGGGVGEGSDPVAAAEAWDEWRQSQRPVGPRRGRTVRAHGAKPTRLPPTEHLVLLAASPDGYRGLGRFITRGQLRGAKDAPAFSWDDLAEVASTREVWALSGCHAGAVPRAASEGDLAGAMAAASRLR